MKLQYLFIVTITYPPGTRPTIAIVHPTVYGCDAEDAIKKMKKYYEEQGVSGISVTNVQQSGAPVLL